MRTTSPLSPLLLIALLAGAGCRSGGGPSFGAEDIVEGRADSTVHPDTIDAPFTVSLDRARWSARARVDPHADFWSAVAVLDMPSAEKAARTMDERTFTVALRTLMAGDPEGAAVAFSALHASTGEALMRSRARIGLTMALSWYSDWPALARIGVDPDSADVGADPAEAQAGVERWARALAELPAPVITVPEEPVVLPMRRSAFGTPVITVRVNGKPREFWLDTGASMTLLSMDVAVEAGVTLASSDSLALGVVAGHIPARAVFIDSLAIGPMRVIGLSAAVVAPGALRLDRRQVRGLAESVPIDGVIGTDLLRHMDIVLDASAETMTIRRPRRDVHAVRNLFWVGYPVVRLVTHDGKPVLFGLDTGAEGSYVTAALLRKMPRTKVAARRMSLSGLGSQRTETQWVVRDIALSDGDYALALRNIPVTPDRRWTFVAFDGMLGSDIALSSRMHLDFANGVFDVRPR